MAGAEAAYTRAESLDPASLDVKIQLGHFYKLIGDRTRAERCYQAAVDGGSTDEHALHFLQVSGKALSDGGEKGDAGQRPGACLAEADAARDAGQFDRASALYKQAAEAYPRGFIFVQLGNCLKEAGSLFAAGKAYRSALELDPDDADCLLQLGHLMKLVGDFGRAETYFSESARLDPKRTDAGVELAALRASGRSQGAGDGQRSWEPITVRPVQAILERLTSSQARRRA